MSFEAYTVILTVMAIFGGIGVIMLIVANCVLVFDYRTRGQTKAFLVMLLSWAIMLEFQFIRGAVAANDLNRVYGSGSSFDTVDDLSDFNARLEALNRADEARRQREAMSHDG